MSELLFNDKKLADLLIRNEIALKLGHDPDDDELKTILDYVHDEITYRIAKKERPLGLTELELAIFHAREDNFKQCEECGEYFLPAEMNDCGYYCLRCKPEYDPDGMIGGWDDLKAERGE